MFSPVSLFTKRFNVPTNDGITSFVGDGDLAVSYNSAKYRFSILTAHCIKHTPIEE